MLGGAFTSQGLPTVQEVTQLLLAAASMLAAVMCVYLLNGLSDINQDRINGSHRPLATGELAPSQVRLTIATLVVADIATAFFLPPGVTICNAMMIVLGLAYSGGPRPAKIHSTFSLLVAGTGATLPYLSAGLVMTGRPEPQLVVTALLLGAWVWAGGASKDLSDVGGDALAGRVTLPVKIGELRARRVIAGRLVFVAAVAAGLSGIRLAAPAMLLTPACAALLLVVARRAPTGTDRRSARGLYRAFMSTQYALNGALVLVPVIS